MTEQAETATDDSGCGAGLIGRVPSDLIDTDRYPIAAPGDAPLEHERRARADLVDRGVAILPGFLCADAVSEMTAECDALAGLGHHSVVLGTPYLGLPDESFPAGHPRRAEVRSSLEAVAYDLLPPTSSLRALYEWEPMLELVSRLLDRAPLHRYADPLGALNVAVMRDGDELGWHFDQTDFVVSIALQSSEAGGDFESACRIRSGDDERYEAVDPVLGGDPAALDAAGVVSVPMTPGTLMLFEGRHSMHRVTPIVGDRSRYVALLAYDTGPDTDSSELLKLVRYGRLP